MRRRVIVAIGAGAAVLFGLGLLANRPHGDQWRVGTMHLLAHRIEVFHSQSGRLPRDLGELRVWATRTGRNEFRHGNWQPESSRVVPAQSSANIVKPSVRTFAARVPLIPPQRPARRC